MRKIDPFLIACGIATLVFATWLKMYALGLTLLLLDAAAVIGLIVMLRGFGMAWTRKKKAK